MTSAPSLPAQIEPSLDVLIGWLQSFKAPHDTRYTKALLVTLQQHERLETVAKAARDLLRHAGIKHPGADVVIVSRERVHTLENALAAGDTAASETPANTELALSRKDIAENRRAGGEQP